MTCPSKARVRGFIGTPGAEVEVRIFKRPRDPHWTRAEYQDDDTPDGQPLGPVEQIDDSDADLLVKLLTGKNLPRQTD